jgi:hypothetical protein
MRSILLVAALLAATPALGDGVTRDEFLSGYGDLFTEQAGALDLTEDGRRLSCRSFNSIMDVLNDKPADPEPMSFEAVRWCAEQPEGIRHKYGSRY